MSGFWDLQTTSFEIPWFLGLVLYGFLGLTRQKLFPPLGCWLVCFECCFLRRFLRVWMRVIHTLWLRKKIEDCLQSASKSFILLVSRRWFQCGEMIQFDLYKRNIWPWHMSERQFATFGGWKDMIDMFPIFTSTIYIYRTLIKFSSLKLTAKAPANGWLEDDRFLLGPGLFFGAFGC